MTETADPLLTVDATAEPGTVVLTLRGELDPHTAPIFDDHVRRALDAGATTVIVDLAALSFIDSSGLRSVIGAHKTLEERGGTLVLRSPRSTTQRLLDVTGLTELLTVEP